MRDGCGHLPNLRLVQRDPQIEDVRVEAGVLEGGVRVGHMRESIADDVGSMPARRQSQSGTRASEEVQRSRARLGHRAGEYHNAAVTFCKREHPTTEIQRKSQSHRGNAGANIRSVPVWK